MLTAAKLFVAKVRRAITFDRHVWVRTWYFERLSLKSLDNAKPKPFVELYVREVAPSPGLFVFVRIPLRTSSVGGYSYMVRSFGFRSHFRYSPELRDRASSMGISAYHLAGRTEG